MHTSSLNKAFTLIELSIVLVIIGLIVGGVVAGQGLVQQAKFRSVISEYKKWQLAINTFRLQYDALPGDFARAHDYWGAACDTTPENCNGNGNRVIEWDNSISPQHNEMSRMWQHLSLAKVIPDNFVALGATGHSTAGIHVPGSAMPSSNGVKQVLWTNGLSTNLLMLAGINTNDSCHECRIWAHTDPIHPQHAYTIDIKIDDGIAGTGRVTGGGGKGPPPTFGGWSTFCTSATDPTGYNLGYTGTLGCLMTFGY